MIGDNDDRSWEITIYMRRSKCPHVRYLFGDVRMCNVLGWKGPLEDGKCNLENCPYRSGLKED